MTYSAHAMLVTHNPSIGRILFNELLKRRVDFEVKFHPDKTDTSMAFFIDCSNINVVIEIAKTIQENITDAEVSEKNHAADTDAAAADAVNAALRSAKS